MLGMRSLPAAEVAVMTVKFRVVLTFLTALFAATPETAAAFQNGRELVNACHALERGLPRKRQHIRIPNTKEALLCWEYMRAAQDMVVLTH